MTTQRLALYVCDTCSLARVRQDVSGGQDLGECRAVRVIGTPPLIGDEVCPGVVRLVGCIIVWPLLSPHPSWADAAKGKPT